jgi:hypothetical protein
VTGEWWMLVFWVILAFVVVGVGGRIGWVIVRTAVQMYVHYVIKQDQRPR